MKKYIKIFLANMSKSSVSTRSAAISYHFFVALFPTLIFIFSLIPYIPIARMQDSLIFLLQYILPDLAYQLISPTLIEIVTRKSLPLLSVGLALSLYFSQAGMNGLIDAFNTSQGYQIHQKHYFRQRLLSLVLSLILPFMLTIAIILIIFGQYGLQLLSEYIFIQSHWKILLVNALRWITIITLIYATICILYHWAPYQRKSFKLMNLGAIMATLLILLISVFFSYYLNQFDKFNKLYGSIGGLLAFLVWLNYLSTALVAGFEISRVHKPTNT